MKLRRLTGFVALWVAVCGEAGDPDKFNYIVGTQTFGAHYQFTDKPRLLETAEVIRDMGSNIIKFRLGPRFHERNYAGPDPGTFKTLKDLAQNAKAIRAVLDMPFYYIFMWVNPVQPSKWMDADGYTRGDAKTEYREIYDLTRWLLTEYNGSGKHFYFGHWEGDWLLVSGFDAEADPIPHRVKNMIKRLNNRQKAIEDAKRDTTHRDVYVFQYGEVNQVMKGVNGKPCYTTEVLPNVNLDYVSYSAYDAQKNPESMLPAALDFIEKNLPQKEGFDGKRVFIGEFGYKAVAHTPEQQKTLSLDFARVAVEWGCPFVLYWQIYDNEFENGEYNGFWLINDQGEKQPLYYAFQTYLSSVREFMAEYLSANGRAPSDAAFRREVDRVIRREAEEE